MQNQDKWKQRSLHWLAEIKDVTDTMFVEFDFNHPSDTTKRGNPVYRITGREEGYVDTGKFHEQKLRKKPAVTDLVKL